MATPNYTQTLNTLGAISKDYFAPGAKDNVYKKTPVLVRMREKCGVAHDGGEYARYIITKSANSQGGAYTGSTPFTVNVEDDTTAARFKQKHYIKPTAVKYTDILESANQKQILNLVANAHKNAELSLANDIETDIFSANTSANLGIEGLRKMTLASDTSNSYGGISTADVSTWVGQADTTTTTLVENTITTMDINCSDGNEKPTVRYTTKLLWNRLANILMAKGHLEYDKSPLMVDAGFGSSGIIFNEAPVIWSALCTAAYMFFLNENMIEFRYHPDDDMKWWPEIMPVDQMVQIGRYTQTLILATFQRRRQGYCSALDYTA